MFHVSERQCIGQADGEEGAEAIAEYSAVVNAFCKSNYVHNEDQLYFITIRKKIYQ